MRGLRLVLLASTVAALAVSCSPPAPSASPQSGGHTEADASEAEWLTDCQAFVSHVQRLIRPGRAGPVQGEGERLIGQQVEWTLMYEGLSYNRVEFDDGNPCPFTLDDSVLVTFQFAPDSQHVWEAVAPGTSVRVSARIAEVSNVIVNGADLVNAPMMTVTLDQARPLAP